MTNKLVIDLDKFADILEKYMDMSEEDWEDLRSGDHFPHGWSYAVLDMLEEHYELETRLAKILTGRRNG